MDSFDRTSWEVLNATADDRENLEQIYRAVAAGSEGQVRNGVSHLREVADRVITLVEGGLLTARDEDFRSAVTALNDRRYVWRAWFRMTAPGRTARESSEYANLADQELTR
jgi:hypothetical protein